MTEAARAALRARLAERLPSGWKTRFAPAPTGFLHLGHAVNAIYVWSIARAFAGTVMLRIEDHDRQRSRDEYERAILADLSWLGLPFENTAVGEARPIRQSDRTEAYQRALEALALSGRVYACRCSRREIAAHTASGDEPWYPGTCRDAAVPSTETAARRLWVAGDPVGFEDLRHGHQTQVPAEQCGDILLRDRRGHWTYQFAVVVDDIELGTDLVIRGDDLLASTGRQIIVSQRLGRVQAPLFLHHPLVRHPDGRKLSKSNGDTSIRELRDLGWTPEQVLGHAACLGGLQPTPEAIPAADLAHLWRPA